MSSRFSPIVMLLAVMFMALPGWALDIYVDSDAPGPHTGQTWTNAYVYLQDALAVAQYGDTIKVAQGYYWPDQATGPHATGRQASFYLVSGVQIQGGYAGYNLSLPSWQWDDRNVQLYQSVLTGDINADDIDPDPNSVSEMGLLVSHTSRQDNCFSVVNASNTDPNTVLDGFIIQGGNSNNTSSQSPFLTSRGGGIVSNMGYANIKDCTITHCSALNGGGFYSTNGDPNLSECTFQYNYAQTYGGGMWNELSHMRLSKSTFKQNLGGMATRGGAAYLVDSNSVIDECHFIENQGLQGGGAIYFSGGDPNISNSQFRNNLGLYGDGGAIHFTQDCNAVMRNCRFVKNETYNSGGAIASYGILRCDGSMFVQNQSNQDSGGAVALTEGQATFVNCVFNANEAGTYGGAIAIDVVDTQIINCTFTLNEAMAGGNAFATIYLGSESRKSNVTVANTIIWDEGVEIFNIDGSNISVTYSTLYVRWPGQGNDRVYPGFENQLGEDLKRGTEDDVLRLLANSNAIDAGNNYAVPDDVMEDLGHSPRFMDNDAVTDSGRSDGRPVVDRGAYEFGDPNSLLPPIADAGMDQNVPASYDGNAAVVLDGSGSEDPDNDPLQYEWTWMQGSETKKASGVHPTVTLPVGQYTIQLVVSDGIKTSEPDDVVITVISTGGRPTANAGPDQTIVLPTASVSTVMLDGSGSYDPDGDALQYTWTWTVNGQSIQSSLMSPVIQLPLGTYTIQLVVFDGTYYSETDSVVITVRRPNEAPVANAGPDQSVSSTGGQANVTLDGSGSYDPDGDALQYTWTWTASGQARSTTGVTPTISLPSGQYSIKLVVSDGSASSQPDYVSITVLQTNSKPVANAGPDQSVAVQAGQTQASVTLDGSGSYDPDGAISQYFWTWTAGGQQKSATGVTPTIVLPTGQYSIKLIVYDGEDYSLADYVQITVTQNNLAPVANAGPDQTKTVATGAQATVTLNGAGSYDPDGTPISNYYWSFVVNGQSRAATGVTPTIQLPVGQYSIQLVVYDGEAYSQADTVIITVNENNQAPVANAGPDQTKTVSAGNQANVTLNGSASYDPDGTITGYYWSYIVSGQSRTATGATPTIQLPAGQYTIQLVVYDGQTYSQADTVVITVTQTNQSPVANAGPDQSKTVSAGNQANVTLNGSASYDPDGTIAGYYWSYSVSGQSRTATGATPTIQLPAGQYSIQLVVYDGQTYSQADTVVITVTQAVNQAPVANAGPDQTNTVSMGSQANVTLNGTGSYDPDGSITNYYWTYVVGGQTRTTTGATPTIQLPEGQFTIQLVVYDGQAYSQADTVVITMTSINQVPVADAGPNQTLTAVSGQTNVTLNGSGSYDLDGSIQGYRWTYVVNGQNYTTSGVSPTIQLPVGQYSIQLVVYDGLEYSQADTVVITVTQGNQVPVANAGPDQTVNLTSGNLVAVTLDGSASYDPDGTVTQYIWSWTVNGQAYQTSGVNPVVLLPVGQHTISLTVSDGVLSSTVDQVVITVTQSQQASVNIWTDPITPNDSQQYVLMMVTLTNTQASAVDTGVAMTLFPGGTQSTAQYATQSGDDALVFVMFNEASVLNSISVNGTMDLTVYGQLTSGMQFFGSDSVTVSH